MGVRLAVMVTGLLCAGVPAHAEPLVIAASPSLAAPLEALAHVFEEMHPGVQVRIYFDSGLDLRRTIAAMENSMVGQYFIGKGPIHLVAPGGDELIDRLQRRYYVLPGTKRPYAAVRLVLVVPESLVEAPSSFEALAKDAHLRVAVADPAFTELGRHTNELFRALGIGGAFKSRLDVAGDARGVLDHLLNGQADAGIIFGPDAAQEKERVRIVAVAPDGAHRPVMHSMAMERFCPNRTLCEKFLSFIQSPEAQAALKPLGYESPTASGGTHGR
jgi:molybdate transport system substrate-binding protein